MKHTQSRNGKSEKRKGMRLRVAQKTSIRKTVVVSSILAMMVCSFIYFNFFNNSSSHAETGQTAYHPTYTTTDINVPVRLLIIPDANDRSAGNINYKNDTAHIAKKQSRGELINPKRYSAD